MKILKHYLLELCFIVSFALPFIKGVNADNGRRFVEIYYGFTFLMEHAIVTAVFISSLLIAFFLKKRWTKWLAAGSYFFNLSVGLLSKHHVGNFVDNEAFEG